MKIEIEVMSDGFFIQDEYSNFVSVVYEGDIAYFASQLNGSDLPEHSTCHKDDAKAEALSLIGFL